MISGEVWKQGAAVSRQCMFGNARGVAAYCGARLGEGRRAMYGRLHCRSLARSNLCVGVSAGERSGGAGVEFAATRDGAVQAAARVVRVPEHLRAPSRSISRWQHNNVMPWASGNDSKFYGYAEMSMMHGRDEGARRRARPVGLTRDFRDASRRLEADPDGSLLSPGWDTSVARAL